MQFSTLHKRDTFFFLEGFYLPAEDTVDIF